MLPVAAEVEANRARVLHGAVASAVASLFDRKAGKAFREAMDRVSDETRRASLRARGVERDEQAGLDAVAAFTAIARKLGAVLPGDAPRREQRSGADLLRRSERKSGSHGR